MERALTEPGLGYYATSGLRPTRAGDFLTAPELHPFFGRCIGRQLSELHERLGSPERFTVLEYGAGQGTLERTTRAGLAADGSPVAGALRWVGVDLPMRSDRTAEEPIVGCVLANEYLDALPVHRLEAVSGSLRERYVTWTDGWFAETTGPVSSPELTALLDAEGVRLADGQVADVSPAWAAWTGAAAGRLRRGALIVIDYGHAATELYGPRHRAGSLVTYRAQRAGDDPLRAIGRQDITAHVDLTAVEDAALRAGLDVLGRTSQAEFLVGLGIGELLASLGERPAAEIQVYLEARSAVARLLDPRHLGGFRVLAFGRGLAPGSPPLRGFAFRVPGARGTPL